MSVSDILSGIGTAAKTVGRAALPIAERTAQVVSGEAPKIDDEQRKQAEKLEDAQIATKASVLENQLAMGQKYGTLTPAQQQQYVDQISGLYSHPRHAGTLMEKLRKAVHPDGAYAQGPQAPLPDATPEGGTAAVDEKNRAKYMADAIGMRQTATDEEIDRRAGDKKPGGKSPPLPGNQLPPDAKGVDGQPLPAEARTAGHSFVEYNGSWWPVAKPKPVFKTVKGHSVLVDPQSGAILRDLGAVGTARVTTHQTLQPGDDGQMHMVTLTSVSTPEGSKIDVTPEESADPPEAPPEGGAKQPAGKTPARKVNPGSIMPKTGAKPAGQAGALPGFSNLANKKIETTSDRNTLESSKQIISAVDGLLPILEKRKDQGGTWDAAKQMYNFEKYKHGIPPDDPEMTKIFENSALLSVMGASLWSKIGRSRYTFEIIQQHLPKPTDTPKLMYDKVKWLKDNVVPAAQDAIRNPQPDNSGAQGGNQPKVMKFNQSTGRLE